MATMERQYTYAVYSNGLWYVMLLVGFLILTLYALLAGLTLAVCGPEMTWLQLRIITGTPTERNRARIIAQMQRHSSWMLCSLVLCTVACAETLPFIIQGLWAVPAHSQWVPILVSTVIIALCAEIVPQYFIPLNPIKWSYFCWPLIYLCMGITAVISLPLAWALDASGIKRNQNGLLTKGELANLIKYHEPNILSPETVKIMRGALQLDNRKVGSDIGRFWTKTATDVEAGDVVVVKSLITRWNSVKTLDINEPVDQKLILKLKQWSHSRIPVVGLVEIRVTPVVDDVWEGKRVYGLLELKSVLGVKLLPGLLIKDLPLSQVPIIQEDMLAHDVISMLQLKISNIAIVVPKPIVDIRPSFKLSNKTFDLINSFKAPCWAPVGVATMRAIARARNFDENMPQATQLGPHTGVKCPKPIGIIALADIIATILQKPTTNASVDYFEGVIDSTRTAPLAEKVRGALVNSKDTGSGNTESVHAIPVITHNIEKISKAPNERLRKRKVSINKETSKNSNLDGAWEISAEIELGMVSRKVPAMCLDGAADNEPTTKSNRPPWSSRYVTTAAPNISPFKRETFSSLERVVSDQNTSLSTSKYKLNPAATPFTGKFMTRSGNEGSVLHPEYIDDVDMSASSSFEKLFPVRFENIDEPYCGDPNSRIFTGPIRTPEPEPQPEMESLKRQKSVFQTIPRMRQRHVTSWEENDDHNLISIRREEAERNEEGKNEALATKGSLRRSSIWF